MKRAGIIGIILVFLVLCLLTWWMWSYLGQSKGVSSDAILVWNKVSSL